MADDLARRLRGTDVLQWPDPVRALAWQMPWISLPLALDPEGGPPRLDAECPDAAPADLFPKIALKSWQEEGRLRLIPGEQPLPPAVAARLSTPTGRQVMVLEAWRDASTPPYLHLFESRDMSTVSELRCRWVGDRRVASTICHRNRAGVRADILDRAEDTVRSAMGAMGDVTMQFAVGRDGRPWILDVNPVLTPADLESLSRIPANTGPREMH
ncbi:hypothetical protein [Jannaschia sp. LMIT008]|uniref:hypothetical protein n=1 Tax=Jannaschia maritima TaxID=3032585 RepID=UPI0028110717|nr:hypothetical protein [Jannaschia sp. LMIT008]